MARTAFNAPAHTVLQRMPGSWSATTSSNAPDAAPSLCYAGSGLVDHRMAYNKYNAVGVGAGAAAAIVGWSSDAGVAVLDQVLATAPAVGTGGIAAAANTTTGTAMTLTTATTLTNGVLITPSALTTMPFLTVIPAGTVVVTSQMGYKFFGTRDITALYDPTVAATRGILVRTVVGGTGGNFTVRGWDVYGQPMSEVIAASATVSTTVVGKKAWKWIASITPGFTDATGTYAFDISTLVGVNLAFDFNSYITVNNGGTVTANPTVAAADATAVSATTGDVRGTTTIATPGGSRVTIFATPSLARLSNANMSTGLFGLVNFAN